MYCIYRLSNARSCVCINSICDSINAVDATTSGNNLSTSAEGSEDEDIIACGFRRLAFTVGKGNVNVNGNVDERVVSLEGNIGCANGSCVGLTGKDGDGNGSGCLAAISASGGNVSD